MFKFAKYLNVSHATKRVFYSNNAVKPSTVAAAAASPQSSIPVKDKKIVEPPRMESISVVVPETMQHDILKIKIQPTVDYQKTAKFSSFDDVPGPLFLRYLSKLWNIVPVLGTHITMKTIQHFMSIGTQINWGGNMVLIKYLLNEYGPVVRLFGPFGGDVVLITRPEHVRAVFESEGPYPVRSSIDCIEMYRLQHRKHKPSGLFLLSGKEWENMRKSLAHPLQVSNAQQFDKIEKVCDDFTAKIVTLRNLQEEVPATFLNDMYKWSLECLCQFLLNERLGFMDNCGLSTISDPGLLLESLKNATRAIQRCESHFHYYKFVTTPAWRSLVTNCNVIDTVLNKYINKTRLSLNERRGADNQKDLSSFLEKIILMDGMSIEDIMTIVLDMLLIGVNSVTHAVSFVLYHLARNPKSQAKLYNEIQRRPIKLSKDMLASMPYLQACIKESLRLKPPMPILGRILTNDINIYNYFVPKDTFVLMVTNLASLRDENYEDPHKFVPERWILSASGTTDDSNSDRAMFSSLPFGYGAKGCVAKELAEIEVGMMIAKIVRKFRVEYNYGDIDSTSKILGLPNRSLKFRFVERL